MAQFVPIGGVIDPKKDRFASTGPHLDFRVIPQFGENKGEKINPRFARSILQNVVVGEGQTPLVQKNEKGQWSWNYPITSEYGTRVAPTKGASTFHSGIDVGGIPIGTQIAYKGAGSFMPGDGMGTVSVTDEQGRPYDIQVLHLDPSKKTESIMNPNAPLSQPYSEIERERDIYQAYAQGLLDSRQGRTKKKKSTKESLKDNLKMQLVSQALNPLGAESFLGSYINSSPSLSQQTNDMYQYFQGLI